MVLVNHTFELAANGPNVGVVLMLTVGIEKFGIEFEHTLQREALEVDELLRVDLAVLGTMDLSYGVSSRRRFSIAMSSVSSVTRSHLLRIMRSAKVTCSTASFSTPSGFSSSRRLMMCFASLQ